LSFNYTLSLIT